MAKKAVRRSRVVKLGKVGPNRSAARRGGSFPIVGIGASAGGLEAFSELLEHLPPDTGMGFVLVQHLDPQHESALVTLLQRKTSLSVQEVTDNLRVKRNHVYVIPPNTHLGIVQGVLKVGPRGGPPRTPARSIDVFFEALAADQHDRAVGVVLSGTATDGTVGLEAIKAEGGITFAQDGSARYDSMPRSAVTAGCVDFVLSPEHIAQELARIATHPAIAIGGPESRAEGDRASAVAHEDDATPLPSGGHGTPPTGSSSARAEARYARGITPSAAEDGFKQILMLLRNHCGVDFSLYKSTTIQRRITRRMVLSRQESLEHYAQFLRGNAGELDALYSDTLISVTSFFRNPGAFDVLKRKVWPAILQQRSHDPVRVWVLGCSTGQEAYSIAMSFVEVAEKTSRSRKLQVFATDLNEALLDKARHGLYAKSLSDDLSPERLRRFFAEEDAGYRISKPLREMVVFARQNLIGDPPFSRMDMVSCRNLLIYFEPDLQKKVFPVFHYALKPGGFLYLGSSESVGGFTELFEPVDKKHKIYARKGAPARALQLPIRRADDGREASGRARDQARSEAERGQAPPAFHGESHAQREADRVTVNQFAPPGVLINAQLQVLQFRGATGAYLEPPTGKATFDVLKMARNGLMMPLRAAINKAKKDKKVARRENVRLEQNGKTRMISIEVIPLLNLQERCFLIMFEDSREPAAPPPTSPADVPRGIPARRVAELESALAETRDYLQSLQEEHEAAHEELQSSSEEVQSANEELQSLNEELETSKEELESSNEELSTFNEEIAHRNTELGRLNAELIRARGQAEAIIRTMRDPFVILNAGLGVESANDAFYAVFKTTAEETEGRSIYVVGNGQWNVQRFRKLLEDILPRNSFFNDLEVTYEFAGSGRRTMLVNARRLVEGDGSAARILLGIHDVTEVLQFQVAARNVQARYQALVEASAQLIWTTDANGAVAEDSPSWRQFTGQTYDQWKGWGWLDAIHPDDRQRVHELWLRTVASHTTVTMEYRLRHVSGEWRWTEVRVVPVFNNDGSVREWIGSNTDITERHLRSDALQEADLQKNVFLAMLAHELRNPLAPLRNAIEILRYTAVASGTAPADATRLESTIEMMERQTGHMARLVDDLLDVSRISRGKITLRIERVDLSRTVRHAVDAALPLMEGKGQALTLTMPPEPLYLSADPNRMAQIVGNLLHNACKFTGDGGRVEIAIESDDAASGEPRAIIRVRDSGIGINAEQLPRIFDMFRQVDASLDRSAGGLGIGLTLVKTLVEMHGGSVDAFSAGLGLGTEFVVRLPRLMAPQELVGAAEDVSPSTAPRRRILIVDDNADASEALALLLTLRGHVIERASDGLEAVERVAAFNPDVVLLDIGLPKLNGYEVASRIRKQSGDKPPRLVALTGWGGDDDRRRSEEAGFDAHLVKPVDEASLIKALEP